MQLIFVFYCLFLASTRVGANQAIQIVQPDSGHSQLLINENSIKLLESITDEVAVIGVVGPFHSGKSFLLNQLMGKTSGFTIGPTVEPTTRGLWMWSEPYKYTTASGKTVSVLFLDTEGFYASNVSEIYDAKIFAVSTLLSSYLVFNSVKVIDQSSIEYLELLARRTQLFGIKAEFANKDSVYKNFINFPPLVWVIEDFFQDLAGQTCTEWLNSFLDGYKRDGEQKSALSRIFPEISCNTVFLPHSELESLRHLDQVPPEQFTKKYVSDMKALREKIFAEIAQLKSSGNAKSFMTGPGIASLLRILVKYANTGDFPEIPSIWSGFLSLQRETSVKYCTDHYKSEVRRGNEVILPEEEFEKLHKKSFESASKLFQQLLFGLTEVYTPGVKILESEIQSAYSVYKADNIKRIEADVKKEHDKKIKEYESALIKITLPVSSAEFSKKNQQLSSQIQDEFIKNVQRFSASNCVKESKEEIKNTMLRIFATYQIKNKELIEARLDNGLKEMAAVYTFEMDPNLSGSMPVTTSSFSIIHKKSEAKAMETFATLTAVAKEEMSYKVYESQAKTSIDGLYRVYMKSNIDKLQQLCESVSQAAVKMFRDGSGAVYGLLPLEDSELKDHLDPLVKSSLSHYSQRLENFTDTATVAHNKEKLQITLNDLVKMVENTNIEQMRIACRTALENSRRILIPIASEYWLTITYRNYAYRIVDSQIGNAIKSATTRHQVVEDFLAKDLKNSFEEVAFWTKMLGIICVCVLGTTMYAAWQVYAENQLNMERKRR